MPARRRRPARSRKSAARNRKPRPREGKMTDDTQQSADDFYSFTIDRTTARVVKVETLDASGARHEVSDQEKASLATGGSVPLEVALEEAFAAGIDCILGDEAPPDEAEASAQDAELRHVLVAPLIQQSTANRLMRREVLDRVIFQTLIQHSIKPSNATPGDPSK